MPEKKSYPCPLCDSTQNKIFIRPKREELDPHKLYGAASGISGVQNLVQCLSCDLIFENPRFSDEIILEAYKSSIESGHDSQYPMRVLSFYRSLISLKNKIPKPGTKILDIGTAGGAFLEAAEKFGYQAYGLEPSQFLVTEGKKRGLKIEQGTIDQNNFPDQSFDMICLWDVIEHLTKPKEALMQIRRLLKPSGILLINYPDIGTWQAKLAGSKFWWIISVHLQHFTAHTLSKICSKTGYQMFYKQPYYQTLEFGYLEDMAAHLNFPFAKIISRFTPGIIKKIPLPYYASQTTALARISS